MENKKQKIVNEVSQVIQECSCNDQKSEKISEIEALRKSVEEKEELVKKYYDQILRLQADFENYRKRSEREKKDCLDWGKEKILLRQVGISDVLQQALQSAKSGNNLESVVAGLEMINMEFLKILKEEGAEEIQCEIFDPNTCEALEYVESEKEDGRILEVYQRGYKINGRLARVAKVRVAKNTKKTESGEKYEH